MRLRLTGLNHSGNKLSILLFTIALLWFLSGAARTSISVFDEARNSECAREMLEMREWVVPTYNYELRTDKPPLHYYFMMMGYTLFGVGPFGARFFSAVAGALTVFLTFRYLRQLHSQEAGLWSALTLLASLHMLFEFHLAVPDPYLILFFSWAMMAFLKFFLQGNRNALYTMYVTLAFATLAKGPVALGLAGLTVLLFLLVQGKPVFSTIRRMKPLYGLLLFFLLVVPWYFLVGKATGGTWLQEFFFSHNLDRFSEPMEGHGGSFILPLLFVLVGMLPLGVFLIPSGAAAVRKIREPLPAFALILTLVVIVFFSLSGTKLPNYPMVCYPFAAALTGLYLAESRSAKAFIVPLSVLMILSLALPAGLYIGLKAYEPLQGGEWMALWFLFIPAGTLAAILWLKKNREHALYCVVAGYMLAGISFFLFVYPETNKANPPVAASGVVDYEKDFVSYKRFNPAFSMYIRKPVVTFHDTALLRKHLEEHPGSYLLTQTRFSDDLEPGFPLKEVFRMQDLFEGPVSIIYEYGKTNIEN